MKLEDQVSRFDYSSKLKELNVYQYSQFYWVNGYVEYRQECNLQEKKDGCSAFTFSELAEILHNKFPYPVIFIIKWYDDGGCYLDIEFPRTYHRRLSKKRSDLYYKINEFQIANFDDLPKTDVNAIAKMLIYLIENKLIKL